MIHTIICAHRPGHGWYAYHHQYGDFLLEEGRITGHENYFDRRDHAKQAIFQLAMATRGSVRAHMPILVQTSKGWLVEVKKHLGEKWYLATDGELIDYKDGALCYWNDPDAAEEMLYQRVLGAVKKKNANNEPRWVGEFAIADYEPRTVEADQQNDIATYVRRQQHLNERLVDYLKDIRRTTLCPRTRDLAHEAINGE